MDIALALDEATEKKYCLKYMLSNGQVHTITNTSGNGVPSKGLWSNFT